MRPTQNRLDKVKALIKDGCMLSGVIVASVERKLNKEKKPDFVIAICASFEEKQKLVKAKSPLKKTHKKTNVYI